MIPARADGPLLPSALLLFPLCLFLSFLFLADILISQDLQHRWWWGGFQLYEFPIAYRVIAAFVALLPLLVSASTFQQAGERIDAFARRYLSVFRRPEAAVPAIGILLWTFRNTNLRIGDAQFYVSELIPREALSERGVLINYDSIGATLFYSRGYRFSNLFLDFDPLTWYNVFGLICFSVFLFWVWWNWPKGWLLAGAAGIALLLTGNWTQTALGAPEHYGQVFLCAAAFGILGVEALRGRVPLWQPCLAFAIGAFFHLMIGWLFPALLYMIVKRWRAESVDGRYLALAALLIPAFFTGLICYAYGFELSYFAGGSAARGKLIPFLSPEHPYTGMHYHYSTFEPRHLAHILQQMLLMGLPGIILLLAGAPLFRWSRMAGESAGRFLLLFTGGTLLLCLLWNPDLEMWRDQDLFAIVGVALCLLGAYALIGPPGEHLDPFVRRRLFAAALLGGLGWRLPMLLWHSILSENYFDPAVLWVTWPFGLGQ